MQALDFSVEGYFLYQADIRHTIIKLYKRRCDIMARDIACGNAISEKINAAADNILAIYNKLKILVIFKL